MFPIICRFPLCFFYVFPIFSNLIFLQKSWQKSYFLPPGLSRVCRLKSAISSSQSHFMLPSYVTMTKHEDTTKVPFNVNVQVVHWFGLQITDEGFLWKFIGARICGCLSCSLATSSLGATSTTTKSESLVDDMDMEPSLPISFQRNLLLKL